MLLQMISAMVQTCEHLARGWQIELAADRPQLSTNGNRRAPYVGAIKLILQPALSDGAPIYGCKGLWPQQGNYRLRLNHQLARGRPQPTWMEYSQSHDVFSLVTVSTQAVKSGTASGCPVELFRLCSSIRRRSHPLSPFAAQPPAIGSRPAGEGSSCHRARQACCPVPAQIRSLQRAAALVAN